MLVGREAERRAIATLLAGARIGTSGVLVLTGEAGIGKSSLLEDAAAGAGEMQVLRAQGVESERAVPFGGLLQLVRPALHLLTHIPVPQAEALASALMLDERRTPDPSRFAVGAATLSLLSRGAEERPIAVLVDDAHELDRPSAEALVFAARRLVTDAVAMLVTTRTDQPGSEVWDALPRLVVGGLDLEAARLLVVGEADPEAREDQVARLHAATGGNPLALLELGGGLDRLDAQPPDIPLRVSQELTRAFLSRVHDLEPDARQALLVAAADSSSMTAVTRACQELGLHEAALAVAQDSALLSVEGDSLRFRHPLVRSAVYGASDPDTRRRVHRALAHAVPSTDVDRFAWHLSQGAVAPDEEAARTLDDVATQASGRGAFAIAAGAHERAAQLSLAPEQAAGRLAAAGRAAWRAGATDRAVELLDQALARQPDVRERALVQELRGAVQTRTGSLREALGTLLDAAAAVEEDDAEVAVRLLSDAVHVCFYTGDARSAATTAARIEALLPRTPGARSVFVGSIAVGMAGILTGSGEAGATRIRHALELVPQDEDLAANQFLLPHRVIGILWLREAGAQRAEVDQTVARLRRQGALGTLPYLLMHVARDAAAGSRWDDAESAYLESIRLAEETGQTTDLAVSQAGLAWLYARQARATQCQDLVAAARQTCEQHGVTIGAAWLDFAEGDLASGQGDVSGAVTHYRRLLERLVAADLSDPDLSPVPELVEAYLQLGRRQHAMPLVPVYERLALAKGQPWSRARAHRVLGLCADSDAFDPHFTAALELHQQTPDLFETARTRLAHGIRLRKARRRADAREPLREALATFERLGSTPWADRAAQELAATGEHPLRRESSVIEALTPQEREISRLLAAGSTTREAAAALFLSPKTVEYHLRHVYLKLGVNSRAALAEALSEGG